MTVCAFDFGYPKNFSEVEVLLENLKVKEKEKAFELYKKVGFFDVPSLYESIFRETIERNILKIGYLYLPPYLDELNGCDHYLSLIPFVTSSTESYLNKKGIYKFFEIGSSKNFERVWVNKIRSSNLIFGAVFHSAPIVDIRYLQKIYSFLTNLRKYSGKQVEICFISSRKGWAGPSVQDCDKRLTYAVIGFLTKNAETSFELAGKDAIYLSEMEIKEIVEGALAEIIK